MLPVRTWTDVRKYTQGKSPPSNSAVNATKVVTLSLNYQVLRVWTAWSLYPQPFLNELEAVFTAKERERTLAQCSAIQVHRAFSAAKPVTQIEIAGGSVICGCIANV